MVNSALARWCPQGTSLHVRHQGELVIITADDDHIRFVMTSQGVDFCMRLSSLFSSSRMRFTPRAPSWSRQRLQGAPVGLEGTGSGQEGCAGTFSDSCWVAAVVIPKKINWVGVIVESSNSELARTPGCAQLVLFASSLRMPGHSQNCILACGRHRKQSCHQQHEARW
jgi:hypothetical protein